MRPNKTLGAGALLLAASLYGLYGIFSRLIGPAFGNFNQNWIRNLLVTALIATVIIFTKTRLQKSKKDTFLGC